MQVSYISKLNGLVEQLHHDPPKHALVNINALNKYVMQYVKCTMHVTLYLYLHEWAQSTLVAYICGNDSQEMGELDCLTG